MSPRPTQDQVIKRISRAITDGSVEPEYGHGGLGETSASTARQRQAVAILKATIDGIAPRSSTFREQADAILGGKEGDWHKRLELLGVLQALKSEIEADYLDSIQGLVEGDVFTDFIEMADELLASNYKDPAAVIAGSVLEGHLRSLARGVEVDCEFDGRPKKAEKLNGDLAKAGAYEKGEQKQITAWLDLRNNAAHGHYEKYDKQQVALLVQGVRAFMLRYPST